MGYTQSTTNHAHMQPIQAIAFALCLKEAVAFQAGFQPSMVAPARATPSMVFSLGRKKAAPEPEPVVDEFCYGLPGALAPVGDFDPLNLLNGGPWGTEPVPKHEVYRWREAELMHGRVAMLAAAGFLVQESYHPLFGGQAGLSGGFEMTPSIFDGIAAIDMFPLMYQQTALDVWWLTISAGIFAAE